MIHIGSHTGRLLYALSVSLIMFLDSLYQRQVNFTIPKKTLPGKYLLRFEQFWPTPRFNTTQWYVNCAHINVIGDGGGIFDGYNFAKFPGTYDVMDPGMCQL
jgi:hypothetical protein